MKKRAINPSDCLVSKDGTIIVVKIPHIYRFYMESDGTWIAMRYGVTLDKARIFNYGDTQKDFD